MSGDYVGELVTKEYMEFSINSGSWNHQYLWTLFPQYDYHTPVRPWEIHCRDQDGIRNCAWQMKAFHYWWIIQQTYKTGEIGLAIGIDNLPFCLTVNNQRENGHIFCHYGSITKLFSDNTKFPLVIASALIPYYPCESNTPKCEGSELVSAIDRYAKIIRPGGVFTAAIMDETGPLHEGRSSKESAGYVHTWTSRQFERVILDRLNGELWQIDEFDTFKNDLSFNLVLKRK